MDDDLTRLGVIPSDRKKLENMGMTTLEQLALQSIQTLGMGPSKGNMLIQRARNILANDNITDIMIPDEDTIEISIKRTDRAIIKSVLNALGVVQQAWGETKLVSEGNILRLIRTGNRFDKILNNAYAFQETLDTKKEEEREKSGITLPEEELKAFARERGFLGFWRNVFSEIHGNDIMKKVIAASMFSTYEEPVHSLIIGEPGSSKTMAKEIITEEFTHLTTVGANTTRSGLVCNLGTGDLGALPHANHNVVLVDEFDKIPQDDIEYCYELLSNGKCTVHSAKLHQNIASDFIMIAFANPKTRVFTGDNINNIGLSPLLMSRCALVVRVRNISKGDRLDLFKKKFYGNAEIKERHDYYDQWVKLSRQHTPQITASDSVIEDYLQEMSDIVDTYYNTSLRRDLRMSDYIRRIPMAIARSSFGDVTDEVVHEAADIIKTSILTWQDPKE